MCMKERKCKLMVKAKCDNAQRTTGRGRSRKREREKEEEEREEEVEGEH